MTSRNALALADIPTVAPSLVDTSTAASPAAAFKSAQTRGDAINAFIARAREIAADAQAATGNALAGLDAIAAELVKLASQEALFPDRHFPVGAQGEPGVYRLAEDADGGFALYASVGLPGKSVPPHDHTTWAIIAGVRGDEHNVVYRRGASPEQSAESVATLTKVRELTVRSGNAIVLQPDDVHTIELLNGKAGVHLHFYGLALDRLFDRVRFEHTQGGTYKTFGPPAVIRHAAIAPTELKAVIAGDSEFAILDVREEGVFARDPHLLFASNVPLSQLEVSIYSLLPRLSTPVVVVDGAGESANLAAAILVRAGYTGVSVLTGGTAAWQAAGYTVFTGTNSLSKAFGEQIEHDRETPNISVTELKARLDRAEDIVVLDSRPIEEFSAFHIPGAIDCPGAELLHRVHEAVPSPDTLIVVNCAGRTRSILGAQSLLNARVPNRVVALTGGTMEWLIAGYSLANGLDRYAATPSAEALTKSRQLATALADRAGVKRIDLATLHKLESEQATRTLYRFDVRTSDEYAAGHLPGWRHAAGGQLVQATDQYVATRGARIVLFDSAGVRDLLTASWLVQLGGYDVFVLSGIGPQALESGPERRQLPALSALPTAWIDAVELQTALEAHVAQLFDIEPSDAYRRRHIEGARYATRAGLAEAVAAAPAHTFAVITSEDSTLAQYVAAELRQATGRDARVLSGGTQGWMASGRPVASGGDANTPARGHADDAWATPYAFEGEERNRRFKAYLDWELGLVAQLAADGDARIRVQAL